MSHLAPIYAPWDGNAEAMAVDIGENPITVRQWRNRSFVPPKYWRKIISAAADRGHELTLEQFAEAAETRPPASEAVTA